jgi:hypothetical protein
MGGHAARRQNKREVAEKLHLADQRMKAKISKQNPRSKKAAKKS